MRLIDADALKKDLTRFYDNEVTAKELIDEQPTVGGWISVKDRLPAYSGNVLVCTTRGYIANVSYSKKWDAFNHYDILGDPGENALWDVTHWMPLPELPEEVSGDD